MTEKRSFKYGPKRRWSKAWRKACRAEQIILHAVAKRRRRDVRVETDLYTPVRGTGVPHLFVRRADNVVVQVFPGLTPCWENDRLTFRSGERLWPSGVWADRAERLVLTDWREEARYDTVGFGGAQ